MYQVIGITRYNKGFFEFEWEKTIIAKFDNLKDADEFAYKIARMMEYDISYVELEKTVDAVE